MKGCHQLFCVFFFIVIALSRFNLPVLLELCCLIMVASMGVTITSVPWYNG